MVTGWPTDATGWIILLVWLPVIVWGINRVVSPGVLMFCLTMVLWELWKRWAMWIAF